MNNEIEQGTSSYGALNDNINDDSNEIQITNSTSNSSDGYANPTSNPSNGDSQPHAKKKSTLKWKGSLEDEFNKAIEHIGLHKAKPKKILEFMNLNFLTRKQIGSKLQKYRKVLKKDARNSKFTSADYINQQQSYNYNTRLPNNNIFNPQLGSGLGQYSTMMNNNAGLYDSINNMNRRPISDLSQTESNLFSSRDRLGFSNGMLPQDGEWRSLSGTSQAPSFGKYGSTSNVLGMNPNLTSGTSGSNYFGIRKDDNGDLVGPCGIRVNDNGNDSLGGIRAQGPSSNGGIRAHGFGNESLDGIRVHGNGHGSLSGIRVHGNGNGYGSFGGVRVYGTGNGDGNLGEITFHGNGNGKDSLVGTRAQDPSSIGGIRAHGIGNGSLDGIRVHGQGSLGGIRVHGNGNVYDSSGNNYFGIRKDENEDLVGLSGIRVSGNGNGNDSLGGIRAQGPSSIGGIRAHGFGNGSLDGIRVHGHESRGGIRVHGNGNGYGYFGGVRVHDTGSADGSLDETTVHGNCNDNDSLGGIRTQAAGSVGGIRAHGTGHGNETPGETLGCMMRDFNNNNMSNHGSSTSMLPSTLSSFFDDKDQSHNNLITPTVGVVPALENPRTFNDHHGTNEGFCDTLNSQFDQNQHQGNMTGESLGASTAYPLEEISDWRFNEGNNDEDILKSLAANSETNFPNDQDINIANQEHGVADLMELPFSFDQDFDGEDFLNNLLARY